MFSLIVARDKNYGIGLDGKIPWNIKEDMKHFKEKTTNNVVIMGGNTYRSIGKPLPNRINLVISKQLKSTEHITVFDNYMDLIRYCNEKFIIKNKLTKKLFVIGGAQIYNWFIENELIYEIYDTEVFGNYNCDTFINLKQTNYFTLNEELIINEKFEIYHYVNMNKDEENYLDLMKKILKSGNSKIDRTNIGTMSLFGKQLEFDLTNNTFPLITTRKLFIRGIFEELMLYLRGQTNSKILEEKKINVWKGNTTREFLDSRGLYHLPEGDMGHSYGFSFRHFGAEYKTCLDDYTGKGYDQLTELVKELKNNPDSRRLRITLWEPNNMHKCPLPPCLEQYQFYVHDGYLSCMMTQRSSDYWLAGGWNVATGSLLTILLADVCGYKPYKLIWNIGDVHIYNNLKDQAIEQCKRTPYLFPKIYFKNKKSLITDYEFTDLEILNYVAHDEIKGQMNV